MTQTNRFVKRFPVVHYRGYKIDVINDQYEIIQGKDKLIATGYGFDNPLAHAKELIDKDFVTPLLLILRKIKEAEILAAKEKERLNESQ